MKRLSILLLWLIIIFNVTEVYADKIPTKGIVCAQNGLNVRSGPRNNYKKISTLDNNTVVEIVSVVGKWYKITAGSVSGYVYSTFVTVTELKETDDSVLSHRGRVKAGRNIAKSASKATLTAIK
ncbi:MAG: SH3 domain-containing protein [Candidatus Riflebacteria bacterium]|nr:SH3 domain-containing protein [Candidatus Riflebacteria bacterium]